MTKDFARLISDVSYRKEFFDGLDRTISILQDHGYYEAVKGYCKVRSRIQIELKMYGIETNK